MHTFIVLASLAKGRPLPLKLALGFLKKFLKNLHTEWDVGFATSQTKGSTGSSPVHVGPWSNFPSYPLYTLHVHKWHFF